MPLTRVNCKAIKTQSVQEYLTMMKQRTIIMTLAMEIPGSCCGSLIMMMKRRLFVKDIQRPSNICATMLLSTMTSPVFW